MGLTPKQEAFATGCNNTEAAKLFALRKLSGYVKNCVKQVEDAKAAMGGQFLDSVFAQISSKHASEIQRAACAAILDLFSPGWRITNPELSGCVTRRASTQVSKWRDAVLKRDSWRCLSCGSGDKLHAHHIVRWVDEPILRVSVDNGATLCELCHIRVHHG